MRVALIANFRVSVALCGSLEAWRESLEARVRIAQQIEGIPIKTIQQAINDGDYSGVVNPD
jgi:hypothetical protein